MKILSGELKGRNFYMPAGIRPTQNVVRKAIFDLIGHDLSGLGFLELFAGSGAVGLEAASFGAKKVTWVENDPRCVKVIEDNLRLLNIKFYENPDLNFQVLEGDSFAMIKRLAGQNKKFDIVFLDPPFGVGLAKKTLKTLMAHDILQPDCFVIIQCDKSEILPLPEQGRLLLVTQRKYGSSVLTVLKSN